VKRTAKEIEAILCAETYPSRDVAVAAAQAVSEPGDIIEIHQPECQVDIPGVERCTCEPEVVVHRGELASG
jgi:hypothetical protein